MTQEGYRPPLQDAYQHTPRHQSELQGVEALKSAGGGANVPAPYPNQPDVRHSLPLMPKEAPPGYERPPQSPVTIAIQNWTDKNIKRSPEAEKVDKAIKNLKRMGGDPKQEAEDASWQALHDAEAHGDIQQGIGDSRMKLAMMGIRKPVPAVPLPMPPPVSAHPSQTFEPNPSSYVLPLPEYIPPKKTYGGSGENTRRKR